MSTAIAGKKLSTKRAEWDVRQRARQLKAHPDCRSTTIKLTRHENIPCVIVGPRQSSSRRDRRNGHPDCRCVPIQIDALQAGKGYVLGVSSAHVSRSWGKRPPIAGTAADLARTRRSSDWKRLSAGAGTKGPRLHDWCYLELADLEAEQSNSANDGLWTRGLLIRRRIADGDLAFFTTWCPAGTSIETLVAVEGHRWAIEDSFETAKNEFGLDHNESRSWHGWHRHVSLVMLVFAMMAA